MTRTPDIYVHTRTIGYCFLINCELHSPGSFSQVMTNCKENPSLTLTIGEKYIKEMTEVLCDFITTEMPPPFAMRMGE